MLDLYTSRLWYYRLGTLIWPNIGNFLCFVYFLSSLSRLRTLPVTHIRVECWAVLICQMRCLPYYIDAVIGTNLISTHAILCLPLNDIPSVKMIMNFCWLFLFIYLFLKSLDKRSLITIMYHEIIKSQFAAENIRRNEKVISNTNTCQETYLATQNKTNQRKRCSSEAEIRTSPTTWRR